MITEEIVTVLRLKESTVALNGIGTKITAKEKKIIFKCNLTTVISCGEIVQIGSLLSYLILLLTLCHSEMFAQTIFFSLSFVSIDGISGLDFLFLFSLSSCSLDKVFAAKMYNRHLEE